jgi:hypothetical protein
MPNRLLREGICTSDPINELTPEAEVMFYRLLVVADDYGYMDARPAILKAQCFPLKDVATPTKIEQWLNALARVGLIVRYESEGKPYLAIGKWEQRQRSRRKYPILPDDGLLSDDCQTDDGLGWGRGRGRGKGASSAKIALSAEGTWENISSEQIGLWERAYPALSLDTELAAAAAWIVANPQNAKSNYARYLTNWFKRAQDRAPRRASGHAGFVV